MKRSAKGIHTATGPSASRATSRMSRRGILTAGLGGAGLMGAAALAGTLISAPSAQVRDAMRSTTMQMQGNPPHHMDHTGTMSMPGVNGEVDHARNGFNPTDILTDFDVGTISILPSGQVLHEYTVYAMNKSIEVVPGIFFPAWTYNGRIPGPTFRVREGDRVRITFINGSTHPHSIHFHGIHPASMDGVFNAASGLIPPGERYIYDPYGSETIYSPDYSTVRSSSSYSLTIGYQGMQYDSISGLNAAEQRYYSPIQARWTSIDPIPGRTHLEGVTGPGLGRTPAVATEAPPCPSRTCPSPGTSPA